ncbi:abl interactor 2 isoform X2 [Nilaparvata lugens]|uniref:abl interactor 2 isoform X2 n=1 Tax=Nilaparvata lugens TaxID=108931 RepID=UPI00193E47EE|nr:abl interactor 2 isoform X2 [Nilaparvata lugens]
MWDSAFKLRGVDPSRESGLGSDSDNMAELAALLNTEIPEGQNSLTDSHTNLERVAEYCEGNYFQAENKRIALEETKNYTTQSLASVAYQINTLAYNFLQLLDLQTSQLAEMESQMNHIAQTVMIHKEKVARREIGVLTANKTTNRQFKIIAPANPEKPIKYVRKPIDYTALDDIGHGVRSGNTPRSKVRGSSQGSIQSLSGAGGGGGGVPVSAAAMVGPAPTTKPPTPPSAIRATGSLSKGSREYRTPPAVAPPQVPSHYAPNYPLGHPRRTGVGYSTLPMGATAQTTAAPSPPPPQVGMVHPQPQTPPPPPPPNNYAIDHMPPPPSPLTLTNQSGGIPAATLDSVMDSQQHHMQLRQMHSAGGGTLPHGGGILSGGGTLPHGGGILSGGGTLPHGGGMHHPHTSLHHTLPHHPHHQAQALARSSPPLPPPPEEDSPHPQFGVPNISSSRGMPIVSDEPDLPGWVPKNYIEKVVAIYDYYADKEDELSFQESAVIYVLKKNDDGWWEGVMDGITGLFPGNYVEPCV